VCFISIYHALILDKILSIHVLVASPSAKHWSSHACRFNFASLHMRLLITCVFFLTHLAHYIRVVLYLDDKIIVFPFAKLIV